MKDYLILKLSGPLQAWGTHTYEDYRPSNLFPTQSGILGLIAASMGIRRTDHTALENLSGAIEYAVRADTRRDEGNALMRPVKIRDFHTVLDARKVDGSSRKDPVVSHREYLCDASFTVALRLSRRPGEVSLEVIRGAVQKPVFTPFLGRRACPPSRPLFESLVQADSFEDALSQVEPFAGVLYGEYLERPQSELLMRDVPRIGNERQFGTRMVGIANIAEGDSHASE